MALGASRGRVIQQLLTESILLALLGGAAGLLLSTWAGRLLWLSLNAVFQGLHFTMIELDLSPDGRVLGYAVGLTLLTGALFGLVPALRVTRVGLSDSMKQDGSPFGSPLGRSRLRGLLVGTQVAVSVGLLVVGLWMASGLVSLRSSDLGFETRDTYTLLFDGPQEKNQALRERLETLPELSSLATGHFPLNLIPTLPITAGNLNAEAVVTDGSDGYFETLGVRLLRGRSFTREEAKQKSHLAVISESTARHLWPREDPLGKRLSLDLNSQNQFTDFEVIGVANDARFADITEIDELHVYLPSMEVGGLLFRIRGDRGRALAAVRSAVQSFEPSWLPSLDMVSLEDSFVAVQRGTVRVEAFLAWVIAIASLAMAGLGIYGVMAFMVSQRTREIGIRVALGATSPLVIKTILVQGLRPVLVGLAGGFVLGAAVNVIERASDPFPDRLARTIFGDWSIYGGLVLMLAIAALASVIPAKRALRVDPAVALRHE
jgi:predicted permease